MKSPRIRTQMEEQKMSFQDKSCTQSGEFMVCRFEGRCMEPFLEDGDFLVVKRLEPGQIKLGELVCVKRDNQYVCHRMILKVRTPRGLYCYEKPDNYVYRCTYIKPGSVVGRAVKALRGKKEISLEQGPFVRYGFVVRFVIPAIIYGIPRYVCSKIFRGLLKRMEEEDLMSSKKNTALTEKEVKKIATDMYMSGLRQRRAGHIPRKEPLTRNTRDFELICARRNLNGDMIAKAMALIGKGVDWELFMSDAARDRLSYLFHNSLLVINDPKNIPEHVLISLKNMSDEAALNASRQYDETLGLLEIFFINNIPAIPLKGPVLSKRLYGDLAARGSSLDIDILIERKNKTAAERLLKEAGYDLKPDNGLGEILGQHTFVKENGTAVDLHIDLNPVVKSEERIESLWQGIRKREENGTDYYELMDEELLLQLTAHMADSVFFLKLQYLSDIHELLTAYSDTLNWERLMEKSKRWRLSNSLYTNLKLCRDLLGSPVPMDAISGLRPGLVKRLFIDMFINRSLLFFESSMRRRFMGRFLKYMIFQILEAHSPRDYFAIFFPPKERMRNKAYLQRVLGGITKLFGTAKSP